MKKVLLMMTLMCLALTANAGEISEKWGIGPTIGEMKMIGGEYDHSNVDQEFGLWFRKGLTPKWSFEATFRYGYVRPGTDMPDEDAGLAFDSTHAFYTNIMHGTLGARYHFAPTRRLSPYAGLHAGFLDFRVRDENGNSDVSFIPDGDIVIGYNEDGQRGDLSSAHLTLGAALGAEFFFSEAVSLDLGMRYSYLVDNDLDTIGGSTIWGSQYADANDGLLEAVVGMTFYFGGNPDKDDDGILNELDKCPEIPEDIDGFQDTDGCPDLDNDGDGLNDDCDTCPDQPEDFDNFQDDDGCPDPDNDGDGVIDAYDNCPNEAEDKDGFQDDDGCPDLDNDGDGILDTLDKCSETPAGVAVDENGCPKVAELKEALVLEGVTFELGSAELRPESFVILDEVAESLMAWPLVKIEIQGHTDSSGSDKLNKELSSRRAESVRTYLELKGVHSYRMTAKGYGEEMPVATNSTKAGRAQNRRVELIRTDAH